MATFTVFFKRKQLGRFHLSKPVITVGREPGSDIFLPQPTVSREHARIEFVEGGWVVSNVSGSKNGLFVNGALVRLSQRIDQGDRIEVSNYIIVVDRADRLVPTGPLGILRNKVNKPPDKAPAPSGHEGIQETYQMRRSAIVRQRYELNELVGAHLAWTEESGDDLLLPLEEHEKPVVIGKSEKADVRIEGGMTVGDEHAKVWCEKREWRIEALGTWFGIKVNGKKVKGVKVLIDGDLIEAGDAEIEFRCAVIR